MLTATPAARRTAGLVATVAAVVATVGDLLLLEVAGTAPADGASAAPGAALLAGHYLGLLAIPLYALGYWHVATAVAPAGLRAARWLLVLGAFGAALGGTIHALTGLVLHVERLQGAAAGTGPLAVVPRWGTFLLPPWGLAATLIAVAWVLWTRAVLTGRTAYPRWTAALSPLALLAAVTAVSLPSPRLRATLLPAGPNLVHALFFGLSAAVLRERTPRAHRAREAPAGAGDPEEPLPDTVSLPIEDALDLHTFAPRDVPSVVAEYLTAARDAGFDEVRIIHGRGRGVQRARVRAVLAGHPLALEIRDAPPERGGWGATVVRLAPRGAGGTRTGA